MPAPPPDLPHPRLAGYIWGQGPPDPPPVRFLSCDGSCRYSGAAVIKVRGPVQPPPVWWAVPPSPCSGTSIVLYPSSYCSRKAPSSVGPVFFGSPKPPSEAALWAKRGRPFLRSPTESRIRTSRRFDLPASFFFFCLFFQLNWATVFLSDCIFTAQARVLTEAPR